MERGACRSNRTGSGWPCQRRGEREHEEKERVVKVSVLGLGQMGTAIAERLIDAGHSVSVWNRSEGRAGDLVHRGATEITSVHDAWEADVCITMLADSAAVTEVALGKGGLAVADSGWGKFLIDMSTVSPESSSQVANAAAANGIKYIRAPVSGNPQWVRAGNLTVPSSADH